MKDKESIIKILKKDGMNLKYMTLEDRADYKFVIVAVSLNGSAIQYASEELQKDEHVMYEAVKSEPFSILLIKTPPKHIIRLALNLKPLLYFKMGEVTRNDKELIKIILNKDGLMIEYIDEKYHIDFDIVRTAVSQNWKALKYIKNKEIRNNHIIIRIALMQNGLALKYLSEENKGNIKIATQAVMSNGLALEYVNKLILDKYDMCNSFDIALLAITQNIKATKFLSYDILNCKEEIMPYIKTNGMILEYISEDLKADYDIVLSAVSENGASIQFANENLKNNIEIAKQAIICNKENYKYLGNDIKNSRELFLKIMYYDYTLYKDAPDLIKNDAEIISMVLQNDYEMYDYAPDFVKHDIEFLQRLIIINPKILLKLEKHIAYHPIILETALAHNGMLICIIDPNTNNYKKYVKIALKQNKEAKVFIPKEFLLDPEIIAILNDNRQSLFEHLKEDGLRLQNLDIKYKSSYEHVLKAVSSNGNAIIFASPELKGDPYIRRIAVTTNPEVILSIQSTFFLEEIEYAISLKPELILELDALFQNDKNLIKFALSKEATLYNRLKIDKDDYDLIKTAINQNHNAYTLFNENDFCDKEKVKHKYIYKFNADSHFFLYYKYSCIKSNKTSSKFKLNYSLFMENGVYCDPNCIQYHNQSIDSIEYLVIAVLHDYNNIKFASHSVLKNNKYYNILLNANSMILKYSSNFHKDNFDTVKKAVLQNGDTIKYASNKMKENKELALISVKYNGLNLQHLEYSCKDDINIVLEAIYQTPLAYMFASINLKSNVRVATAALLRDGDLLKYAPNDIRQNKVLLYKVLFNSPQSSVHLSTEPLVVSNTDYQPKHYNSFNYNVEKLSLSSLKNQLLKLVKRNW